MLFVHMTVELNFIGYMMTPEQTPLTDEGWEMQLKALGKASKWIWSLWEAH